MDFKRIFRKLYALWKPQCDRVFYCLTWQIGYCSSDVSDDRDQLVFKKQAAIHARRNLFCFSCLYCILYCTAFVGSICPKLISFVIVVHCRWTSDLSIHSNSEIRLRLSASIFEFAKAKFQHFFYSQVKLHLDNRLKCQWRYKLFTNKNCRKLKTKMKRTWMKWLYRDCKVNLVF